MADETLEPELPEAPYYHIEARDLSGEIASQGRVPADRVKRARRLFLDEGWTVTVTPLPGDEPLPAE